MQGWKRNFAVVWTAQFLSIFAWNLVWPFLPLYLQEIGVSNTTDVAVWASILGAGSSLMMAVFGPVWGALADRFGRKPMVVRSMVAGAFTLALMGLATDVYQLLVLRLVQGATTGTIAAMTALAAGIVPRERVGFALGLQHAAIYTGYATAPVIGGLLAGATNYRFPFFITCVVMFAGAVLVMIAAREPPREPARVEVSGQVGANLLWVIRSPAILLTAVVYFMVYFGNMAAYPILPLVAQELVGNSAAVAGMVGLLFAVTSITSAISSVSAGRLGEIVGFRLMLVVATAGAGVWYLPQAFATSMTQLLIYRAVLGLFLGGAIPSANALVARAAPASRHGSAFGITATAMSLGSFAGPLVGAVVASQINLRAVFLMTGGLLLLVALWVLVVLRRLTLPAPRAEPAPAVAVPVSSAKES